MGDDWMDKIDKALRYSNVAILLVSASFAASKFIQETELESFLKRKASTGYLILPILVRAYDFSEFEKLSSLNFFRTYYRAYGFNKPEDRHKLLPFDVLGDSNEVLEQKLNLYYNNLSEYVHNSVSNYLFQ